MSPIIFTLTILAPRVENLTDYAAGLLVIQRNRIPQNIWIHPQDHAALLPLITAN
jgi:hypothetical protein